MHRKISQYLFSLLTGALFFALSLQSSYAQSVDNPSAEVQPDSLMSDSLYTDTLTAEELQMPWDERLKQSLSRMADEADNDYFNTGFCVYDLTADSLLYAYNQHKVMRPASTQKLVTAISALSLLGAKYEYKTRAYYTGTITPDSILEGDIYVVGDFDPSYSYGDLKELAKSVRSLNLKGIRGNLYADISMKDSLLYGNGWCWDDVPSENIPFLCPLMLERGQVAPNWNKYSTSVTFHPAIYFLQTLGNELKSIGADTLQCKIKSIETRTSPKLFYTKTRTIANLLPHMMKSSDNLYAESMFFHLASINNGRWADWKDGARQVENMLRKAKIPTTYVDVADGSGVSLYNYISPKTELSLLIYAYNDKTIFDTLLPSLPVSGVDGTLRKRMCSGPAYKNIFAKTGTVSGVSCLAGYALASNGHLLAFSIMNNGLMKVATGRAYQDRLCQELCK